MSSGKVLASVLAGAAAGAVLGILFAPDKGIETRKKIAEKGTGLADTVKDKYNEYADVISEKYDAAKEKISGLASEGRDMLNQAKDKGNSLKSDLNTDIKEYNELLIIHDNINIPVTGFNSMEKGNQKSAIEMIFEKIKDYFETRVELIKLKAIDKSSSLLSALIAFIAVFVIFIFVFIFINIGIALLIGDLVGKSYAGFLILGAIYAVVGIIILKNKDKWVKTPVINMMVKGLYE